MLKNLTVSIPFKLSRFRRHGAVFVEFQPEIDSYEPRVSAVGLAIYHVETIQTLFVALSDKLTTAVDAFFKSDNARIVRARIDRDRSVFLNSQVTSPAWVADSVRRTFVWGPHVPTRMRTERR